MIDRDAMIDKVRRAREATPEYELPPKAAFLESFRFIRALPDRIAHAPAIKTSPMEVRLSWRTDRAKILVGFYGDGEGGSYVMERFNFKGTVSDRVACDDFKAEEPPAPLLHTIASWKPEDSA